MTPPCCPQNIDFAAFGLFLRQFTLNEHMSAAAGEAKTPALMLLVQSSEKLNVNPTNVFPFRCSNKIQRIDTNNCMFLKGVTFGKKHHFEIFWVSMLVFGGVTCCGITMCQPGSPVTKNIDIEIFRRDRRRGWMVQSESRLDPFGVYSHAKRPEQGFRASSDPL